MPLHTIENTTGGRIHVRTSTGLKLLMPGESATLDVAASHATYYERSGATVTAVDGTEGGKVKRELTDLDGAELRKTAETEGVDLGDLDLDSEPGRAAAVATIRAFRDVWATGNTEAVRDLATRETIDLAGATSKRDIVNRIVASRGISL